MSFQTTQCVVWAVAGGSDRAPASLGSVSSCITSASQPSGTGAPVPEGCDALVMQEETEPSEAGARSLPPATAHTTHCVVWNDMSQEDAVVHAVAPLRGAAPAGPAVRCRAAGKARRRVHRAGLATAR
ncbi:hypothetical protein CJP07_29615, partial [Klebsiella pneumoniae]